MRIWLAGITALVSISALLVWLLAGGNDPTEAVFGGPGDITTESAVVQALNETPYEIRYRRVPRVEGYEIVAGRARSADGGVVDFSIVIRKGRRIEHAPESRKGGSPQFPVVRYLEEGGTIVGNSNFVDQAQGGYVVQRLGDGEKAWLPTHEENEMSIRLGIAIRHLFASNVDAGP